MSLLLPLGKAGDLSRISGVHLWAVKFLHRLLGRCERKEICCWERTNVSSDAAQKQLTQKEICAVVRNMLLLKRRNANVLLTFNVRTLLESAVGGMSVHLCIVNARGVPWQCHVDYMCTEQISRRLRCYAVSFEVRKRLKSSNHDTVFFFCFGILYTMLAYKNFRGGKGVQLLSTCCPLKCNLCVMPLWAADLNFAVEKIRRISSLCDNFRLLPSTAQQNVSIIVLLFWVSICAKLL